MLWFGERERENECTSVRRNGLRVECGGAGWMGLMGGYKYCKWVVYIVNNRAIDEQWKGCVRGAWGSKQAQPVSNKPAARESVCFSSDGSRTDFHLFRCGERLYWPIRDLQGDQDCKDE